MKKQKKYIRPDFIKETVDILYVSVIICYSELLKFFGFKKKSLWVLNYYAKPIIEFWTRREKGK